MERLDVQTKTRFGADRMANPLEGIRILDASNIVSGPFATAILGDQGADVIKLEQPGIGDLTRYLGPMRNGISAFFCTLNRNKRSIAIDLKQDEGRGVVYDLAKTADVFVQNYRPGVAERMGLGYDKLKAINPDIIYASISGFGDGGPYSKKRVYDPVIQAVTGLAAVQSGPGSNRPDLVRTIVCDKVTSLTTCQAITAAIAGKLNGKGGCHLRVSMLEAALQFLWPDTMYNQTFVGEGASAFPDTTDFYQIYDTQDGYLAAIVVSDDEWAGFCRAVGRPELAEDEDFAKLEKRISHAETLFEIVEQELAKHPSADIVKRLEEEDVPAALVNTREQVMTDPQIVHQGSLFEVEHDFGGTMRHARPAARFDDGQNGYSRLAPGLGEHTDEILSELRTNKDLADLRARKVVA